MNDPGDAKAPRDVDGEPGEVGAAAASEIRADEAPAGEVGAVKVEDAQAGDGRASVDPESALAPDDPDSAAALAEVRRQERGDAAADGGDAADGGEKIAADEKITADEKIAAGARAGRPSSATIVPPVPVLALVRPIAVLALIAMLFGRVLGPASAGLVVGIGRLLRVIELMGGALTQLLAMGATVLAMSEILAVLKSRLSVVTKFAAVGVGGVVIIVGISASATRVPAFSSAVVGVGAALLAVIAAWDVRRVPIARAFALALGLVGVAALVRMGSIGLAVMAGERASARLAGMARVAATGSFVLDACVLLVAMAILAAGSRKLTSPLTAVSLFLALVATRYALAGTADDAGTASLLFRRAAERLLTRPDPFGPVGLRVFVAALSVFIAIGALLARGRIPAFMGALSLLLVARGSPDMPLGALLLVVASLSLALASKDERGVWAALTSIQIRSRSGGASGEAEGAPRAPDTPMRAGLSKGSGER